MDYREAQNKQYGRYLKILTQYLLMSITTSYHISGNFDKGKLGEFNKSGSNHQHKTNQYKATATSASTLYFVV